MPDWCDTNTSSFFIIQGSSLLTVLACSQGAQGKYDAASAANLENEFGTSVDDKVIQLILEKGKIQTSEVSRQHESIIGRRAVQLT